MEGIRATLHALPRRVRHVLPRGLAARRRPVADRARVRPAARAGPPVRVRGRAVAAHDRLRRRQGPRARAPDRRADVLRRRRRLPGGQVPARLRPGDLRARRRPPRLHRAAEGDREHRSARTRTGVEVPMLQFVHIVEGGGRAKMSKRRGDFVTLDELIETDRRRRDALVHALPLARLDDRPRCRARGAAGPREPRLLRADDARADRRDLPAAPGGPGRARRSPPSPARWRSTPPSAS